MILWFIDATARGCFVLEMLLLGVSAAWHCCGLEMLLLGDAEA